MDQQPMPSAGKDLKDKSLPELMFGLSTGISGLVNAEIALAKARVGEKVSLAGLGAGLIFGAVLALTMAVFTGTALVIIALANLVDLWLAAFIVMGIWLLLAVALALAGKGRFKRI